jgi:hypothetical protein
MAVTMPTAELSGMSAPSQIFQEDGADQGGE